MFTIGTFIVLLIVFAWWGAFILLMAKDLKDEGIKSSIPEEELDPFLFTGEKARAEAAALYQTDPVVKRHFDEEGITPFLTAPKR